MEYLLMEAQWARIAPLLPGRAGTSGGLGQDNRRFVEAVLWLARNGCRWRALPAEWGNWHTTYSCRWPAPAPHSTCPLWPANHPGKELRNLGEAQAS